MMATVFHIETPPPLTPPHKGEGDSESLAPGETWHCKAHTPTSPSPLWGGVRGGGMLPAGRALP